SRTRRHLPWPQDHCPTRPRDRQSIRNADRGNLRQASFRQIFDQDLRQIRPRPAHRDHHQRRSAFKHYRKSLPPRRRGWNIGRARQPAALPPSERPSTASTTSVRSCSVAIVAISNTSPVWTTSRLASGRSTVSPNPVPSKAATSTAATFSAATNGPCSRPCNVQASTSPASAAPTSCCGSPNALLQPSPDNALVCAISASSNASPALIATILPALAAPPSPPAAASPNTPLFLLSPDKSAHKMPTLSS